MGGKCRDHPFPDENEEMGIATTNQVEVEALYQELLEAHYVLLYDVIVI